MTVMLQRWLMAFPVVLMVHLREDEDLEKELEVSKP